MLQLRPSGRCGAPLAIAVTCRDDAAAADRVVFVAAGLPLRSGEALTFDSEFDAVFSNAALHWLPDHAALFPRLAGTLARGGVLALQMPAQHDAPSHRLLREVAATLFPDRFDWSGWRAAVGDPADYEAMLAPLGRTEVWTTTYDQRLAPVPEGHPVRHFTASTAMRPIVERLDDAERARFVAAYDRALATPYPPEGDGTVLFPFRRLFAILRRPD